ncbi:MAG: hypothetical protein GF417_07460, partial [Candidatus Latescibacteria bacterium]|nr:hypothetical protein [bacterium]MBD3424257.1 hypothetical protein [Candidatus Latescibacterota bacterium]
MREYVEMILENASGQGVECEVFAEDTRGIELEVHRGEVESIEKFRDRGVGIRVARGRRVGYAFTSELSGGALEKALLEAARSAEVSSPALTSVLADRIPMEAEPGLEEPEPAGIREITERVIEMEAEAIDYSPEVVNTRNAGYSESWTRVTVGSSKGFVREENRGYC